MKIVLATLHARRSAQATPLAAGCLAAALPEERRRDTLLLDLFPDQTDAELLAAIQAARPGLVAFSVYVWNRQRILQLAARLRAEQPDLRLVAGGPEVTGDPEGMATAAPWDALILGEGEASFAELLSSLEAPGVTAPPAGVIQRIDGRLIAGAGRPPRHDLAELPSPWLTGWLEPTPQGGVLWEVARGCAFACDYCFDARGQAGVRNLDPGRLAAELEWFGRAGVSQVWVLDATFNYPPERGIQLLELLLAKAPQLHYHLEAKADFFDRQTVSLLGRLHCSIQLGLQSVNPEVLKLVHRPLDLERLTERVHLLAAEGVTYGFDLIYGLPGDDFAGFCQSLDAAMALAPNHVHIFPLAILPGTRLAQQRERHGIEAQTGPPYEVLATTSWTARDLAASRDLAAATDLFYNLGRAVACLPALVQALGTTPSQLFMEFVGWYRQQPELPAERFYQSETWTTPEVYALQQRFITAQLQQAESSHLLSAALDLLCYHYHYAETLLGEELSPPAPPAQHDLWETPWQLSAQVRLVPFAYEIFDLLAMEGADLLEFSSLFRPVGSVALFMRRGEEVFCESLEEDFLRLLQRSDGSQTPRQIFAGALPRDAGEEMVEFAVMEGLLCRPGPAAEPRPPAA